jgi:formamidopyrimidine-DNA glycosylase
VPELPELEAFVIAQQDALTAEPVAAVPVAHFATVKTIDPPIGSLAGQRFTRVGRRAKRILFESEGGDTLVLHLMSAGKLTVGAKRTRSAVLVIEFAAGPDLLMTETGSKRRAAAWLLHPDALAEELAHIGPEPLDPDFTVAALRAQLEARPHQLHAFLRDQRAVAGIGRAFANEILHAAMLSPYQRGAALADEEVERLHTAITSVLGDAVERLVPLSGNGLTTKADRGYAVHDRLGRPCPRCGDTIRRVSFEEHTVFYCPTCQTGGRTLADRRLSRLLRE